MKEEQVHLLVVVANLKGRKEKKERKRRNIYLVVEGQELNFVKK